MAAISSVQPIVMALISLASALPLFPEETITSCEKKY